MGIGRLYVSCVFLVNQYVWFLVYQHLIEVFERDWLWKVSKLDMDLFDYPAGETMD